MTNIALVRIDFGTNDAGQPAAVVAFRIDGDAGGAKLSEEIAVEILIEDVDPDAVESVVARAKAAFAHLIGSLQEETADWT